LTIGRKVLVATVKGRGEKKREIAEIDFERVKIGETEEDI
jgi:hypothetical protein